jgi:hypothetical protein
MGQAQGWAFGCGGIHRAVGKKGANVLTALEVCEGAQFVPGQEVR